jgi:hypothetical protein
MLRMIIAMDIGSGTVTFGKPRWTPSFKRQNTIPIDIH